MVIQKPPLWGRLFALYRQALRRSRGACFSELILIEYPQDLVEGLVHLVLTLLALHLVQGLGRAAVLRLCGLGHSSGIGGLLRLVKALWR